MQRIKDATAAVSQPAPPTLSGATGYFTEGSPGVTPATRARGWWFNMIQEELMAILAWGGIAADTTALVFTQVRDAIQARMRLKLTADLDLYVATTGNDSTGTGLTIGSPFLTIQHAVDVVYKAYDLQGFSVTIHIADGTYTAGAEVNGKPVGGGSITFLGNTGTPTNVIIDVTSGNCFNVIQGAGATINAMVLKATGSVAAGTGNGCLAQGSGNISVGSQTVFDDCQGYQIFAALGGAIGAKAGYTISGDAQANVAADTGGLVDCGSSTVALSGTPVFGTGFAVAGSCGVIRAPSMTFTGTGATGPRYLANLNGVINTNGGGATYFPGNAGGSAATGGQYA